MGCVWGVCGVWGSKNSTYLQQTAISRTEIEVAACAFLSESFPFHNSLAATVTTEQTPPVNPAQNDRAPFIEYCDACL